MTYENEKKDFIGVLRYKEIERVENWKEKVQNRKKIKRKEDSVRLLQMRQNILQV